MTAEPRKELEIQTRDEGQLAPTGASAPLVPLQQETHGLVVRMFADPHTLEKNEREDLVSGLRESVARHPQNSELRVLLGMALCVNYDVQDAIEELREGVRLAPDSFIAQLKLGELWMRLRVCEKAEEHTRRAAALARHPAQVELARRQAASIRKLVREGVQRGGYRSPLAVFGRIRRALSRRHAEPLVVQG
jgi:predicted Zn-dependent protease